MCRCRGACGYAVVLVGVLRCPEGAAVLVGVLGCWVLLGPGVGTRVLHINRDAGVVVEVLGC